MLCRKVAGGTPNNLNGNLAANKQKLTQTWDVSIPPATDFYIKWYKYNVASGESSGLAVDDLNVTVTFSARKDNIYCL